MSKTKRSDALIDAVDGLGNVRSLLHIAGLALAGPNAFEQAEVDAMATLVGLARDKLDDELKALNCSS
jgi:hypothetical protein